MPLGRPSHRPDHTGHDPAKHSPHPGFAGGGDEKPNPKYHGQPHTGRRGAPAIAPRSRPTMPLHWSPSPRIRRSPDSRQGGTLEGRISDRDRSVPTGPWWLRTGKDRELAAGTKKPLRGTVAARSSLPPRARGRAAPRRRIDAEKDAGLLGRDPSVIGELREEEHVERRQVVGHRRRVARGARGRQRTLVPSGGTRTGHTRCPFATSRKDGATSGMRSVLSA